MMTTPRLNSVSIPFHTFKSIVDISATVSSNVVLEITEKEVRTRFVPAFSATKALLATFPHTSVQFKDKNTREFTVAFPVHSLASFLTFNGRHETHRGQQSKNTIPEQLLTPISSYLGKDLQQRLNQVTITILDKNGASQETEVGVLKFDQKSGIVHYSFVIPTLDAFSLNFKELIRPTEKYVTYRVQVRTLHKLMLTLFGINKTVTMTGTHKSLSIQSEGNGKFTKGVVQLYPLEPPRVEEGAKPLFSANYHNSYFTEFLSVLPQDMEIDLSIAEDSPAILCGNFNNIKFEYWISPVLIPVPK